jgi:hypothetical protein
MITKQTSTLAELRADIIAAVAVLDVVMLGAWFWISTVTS